MFVLLCLFMRAKTGSVIFFLPPVTPVTIMFGLYSERITIVELFHDRDTCEFSEGHITKIQLMVVAV